jgi:hypothetical protein
MTPVELDKFTQSVETYVQTVCILLGEKMGNDRGAAQWNSFGIF